MFFLSPEMAPCFNLLYPSKVLHDHQLLYLSPHLLQQPSLLPSFTGYSPLLSLHRLLGVKLADFGDGPDLSLNSRYLTPFLGIAMNQNHRM